MLSRIACDRERAAVRIDPRGSRAREADQGEYIKKSRIRWVRLIRMVWLEDPLLCSRCGGEMRIISFITDRPVIDRILRHIGFTIVIRGVRGHPPGSLRLSPLKSPISAKYTHTGGIDRKSNPRRQLK